MESSTPQVTINNNPIALALGGVKQLYAQARGIFWLFLVISVLSALSNLDGSGSNESSTTDFSEFAGFGADEYTVVGIFIALMVVVFIVVSLILWGMVGFTAAQLTENKKTSIKEAFNTSRKNLGRLFTTGLIMLLRLLGWTLLFIIPGFIMAVRYSLTSVTLFKEPDLKPGQVVSRSAQLTKGAWMHTFATRALLSLLTLTLLDMVIDSAAQAKLYPQLKSSKDGGETTFKTHLLSKVFILVPLTLMIVSLIFSIGVISYIFNMPTAP